MGGGGPERHASLASGANVVAKLRRYPDLQVGGRPRRRRRRRRRRGGGAAAAGPPGAPLPARPRAPRKRVRPSTPPPPNPRQVEAFLLPPCDAGEGEARRRAALLRRATEFSVLGIPQGEWPEGMGDAQLRCGGRGGGGKESKGRAARGAAGAGRGRRPACAARPLPGRRCARFASPPPPPQRAHAPPHPPPCRPYPPPRPRSHMPPLDLPLPKRLLWALHEPQLQRASAEAALCAVEAAARLGGTAHYGLPPEGRMAREAQAEVSRELDALLVQVRVAACSLFVCLLCV